MTRLHCLSAALLYLSLASATASAQAYLGNPSDAYSCYSHCGETRKSGATVTCYCDSFCQSRGDCCADKDEFCSVSAAAPYCALTNNNRTEFGGFCGTDLGFSYTHNGAIEVLFGDSWQYFGLSGTCYDPGVGGLVNDDSQGTLPLARPAWLPFDAMSPGPVANNCPSGTFAMDMDPLGFSYQPITLSNWLGWNISLGGFDTPLTGFSDGINAWALFGSGLPPLHSTYVARRIGPDTNYRALPQTLPSDKFQSPSATVVTSLTNFDPPTGSGGVLLIFGRPRFNSDPTQDPNSNLPYLMYQNLPLATNGSNWSPKYFQTRKPAGDANWTPNVNSAAPILDSDFAITQQLDVKYVPQIKKWVMLYGGSIADWFGIEGTDPTRAQPRHGAIHMRTADYPWGPWTRPVPLLFREQMGPYYHCDATPTSTPAGCDNPWSIGNWTQGGGAAIPGCTTDLPEPKTPTTCGSGQQRGNLYAPNMIVPWNNGGVYEPITRTTSLDMSLLVSSWFPYQVNLALVDLLVHAKQTFSQGIIAQLRDTWDTTTKRRMVSRASTTQASAEAGADGNNAPANTTMSVGMVTPASGCTSYANRGPVIGDTVYFVNSKTGTKLLSRSGTSIAWLDNAVPIPASAKWILESTNTTDYPNCTPIRFGITPFRLRSTSNYRLRSSSASHTLNLNTAPSGNTYEWQFQLACMNGDNCVVKP